MCKVTNLSGFQSKISFDTRMLTDLQLKLKKRLVTLLGIVTRKDSQQIWLYRWRKANGEANLRFDYPLTQESIIFDVGAFEGQFAEKMHSKFKCTIYCFEPVKEYYETCTKKLGSANNILCLNYGLLDANKVVPIAKELDASSIFAETSLGNMEYIIVKKFSDVVQHYGIEKIDLIKLNIEGAEYDLLNHIIKTEMIHRIKFLQIQFHGNVQNYQLKRNQLRQLLAQTHVEQWSFPFVWESWQRKE